MQNLATCAARGKLISGTKSIYSGFSLAAFGWSLIWNSIAALVAALLLLAFFDIKARREECWLEEKFPGYAAYKSRVKKLIPFLY